MVVIPQGKFLMGSPGGELGRDLDEGPVHEVSIGYDLAVGKYPVTRGEWRRYLTDTRLKGFVGHFGFDPKTGTWKRKEDYCWSNPGYPQDDQHPVVCVTWQEAVEYAIWLSSKTGYCYRLLSEAEYEYVNRAGTQSAYWWGDSSEDLWRYANGADAALKAEHNYSHWVYAPGNDGFVYTSPVGYFPANPFGLYDTTGNVFAWTQDCWHDNYEGAPLNGSVWGSRSQAARVIRGGSWSHRPRGLRSASRGRSDLVNSAVGVRLARTEC
jgi:formylglycine-generating enzyme required for sulfatase activity